MKIRRATQADAATLAQVHIDSWRSAYRKIVPALYLSTLDLDQRTRRFQQILAAPDKETHLAEENDEVLGYVSVGSCRDADVDHRLTGEIMAIYLAPRHWRKGTGTALYRRGEEILRSQGYSQATLWVFEDNDQARMFYEAMGFKTDGATRTLDLGVPLALMRYHKELDGAEPT